MLKENRMTLSSTDVSTDVIKDIKENVLKLSSIYGKGIHLEINAINNGIRENCKIKLTLDVE